MLEFGLLLQSGRAIGAIVRDAAGVAAALARNPFPDVPTDHVLAVILDEDARPAMLDQVIGQADHEAVRLGQREIYVRYGSGMGRLKRRIPAAARGTARNLNTVAKLAAMTEAVSDDHVIMYS